MEQLSGVLQLLEVICQKDNSEYFEGLKLSLVEWLRQYASPEEESEAYLRSFLGRMLFSGEEALKRAHVLSGGEKNALYVI